MFVRTDNFRSFAGTALGLLASKLFEPPVSTLAIDLISEMNILSTTSSESILAKKMLSLVKISCRSRHITFACTVRRSTIPCSSQVSLGGSGVNNEERCFKFGCFGGGGLPRNDPLKLPCRVHQETIVSNTERFIAKTAFLLKCHQKTKNHF